MPDEHINNQSQTKETNETNSNTTLSHLRLYDANRSFKVASRRRQIAVLPLQVAELGPRLEELRVKLQGAAKVPLTLRLELRALLHVQRNGETHKTDVTRSSAYVFSRDRDPGMGLRSKSIFATHILKNDAFPGPD